MSEHLSDDVLRSFVDGLLDERGATRAALHIDDCPRCAARCLALEPLGPAFAACTDPPLPPGFERRVLEALDRGEPADVEARAPLHRATHAASFSPGLLGVGAGLISVAAALMAAGGQPTSLVWKMASVLRAAAVTTGFLVRNIPAPAFTFALGAALALAGILTALRLIGPSREAA